MSERESGDPQNLQLTLGEALSFTTAKLFTERDRLLQLCHWFVGADFPSQLLPYVANEVRSHILKSYPQLEAVAPPWARGEGEKWQEWLAERITELGDSFTVEPLADKIREEILGITDEGPLWVTASGDIQRK